MKEKAIDSILKTLPTLSDKDLKKIKISLSFLLGDTFTKNNSLQDVVGNILYDSLQETINAYFKSKVIPFFPYFKKSSKHYKKFIEESTNIEKWVTLTFSEKNKKISRIQKKSIYNLMANLILKDLIESGTTVTTATMIFRVSSVPAYLDKAFPGYLASGFLPFLLANKKLVKNSCFNL